MLFERLYRHIERRHLGLEPRKVFGVTLRLMFAFGELRF